MSVPFAELWAKRHFLVGEELCVTGHLLVTDGRHTVLSQDYDAYSRGDKVPVRDNGRIARHLISMELSRYVGGDVIYDEEAVITGTLRFRDQSHEFTDVRECTVFGEEIEIVIPFK